MHDLSECGLPRRWLEAAEIWPPILDPFRVAALRRKGIDPLHHAATKAATPADAELASVLAVLDCYG